MVKTGISGGKISKNKKSYRATRQVNKWNGETGSQKYDSEIKEIFPAGPNARENALNAEKTNAERLRREGQLKDKKKHQRP